MELIVKETPHGLAEGSHNMIPVDGAMAAMHYKLGGEVFWNTDVNSCIAYRCRIEPHAAHTVWFYMKADV
jgi:hypothetical protein